MRPHWLERKNNRNKTKVKADVVRTKKILRDDIRDVLMMFDNREDAIEGLHSWLESIDSPALEYRGSKKRGIDRILSDVDSYKIQWGNNA